MFLNHEHRDSLQNVNLFCLLCHMRLVHILICSKKQNGVSWMIGLWLSLILTIGWFCLMWCLFNRHSSPSGDIEEPKFVVSTESLYLHLTIILFFIYATDWCIGYFCDKCQYLFSIHDRINMAVNFCNTLLAVPSKAQDRHMFVCNT